VSGRRHLHNVAAPGKRAAGGTKAVILAGGRGTRLAPYTSILPKPLMPIGERSILETVVDQLESHGFTHITFCVGYLSHLIRAVFDARGYENVRIDYVQEEMPLGTAAPLKLVDDLDETFLMMNGDVLTTLDYRDLVRHHHAAGNLLTVATRKRRIKIDYGVVHVNDEQGSGTVLAWEEKPEIVSTVSMGIYVLEPAALAYVPTEGHFDVPDLVHAMVDAGERVGVYRHEGLWFDIGRQEDYHQAVATWFEHDAESETAEDAVTTASADTGAAARASGAHAPSSAATSLASVAHGRGRRASRGKLVR